jgi:tyrosyl-DNA phosphodiesterase 2
MFTTDPKWISFMVTFAEESSKPNTLPAYRFVPEHDWVPAESPSAHNFPATELQLITWNVDAGADQPKERLTRILKHLRKTVFRDSTPPPPCCILLQEVHEDVLPALLRSRWVREHFLVTPISTDDWTTPYGVVTLVSKAVPVSTVFVIELPKTTVGRQALFVDVHVSGPPPESGEGKRDNRTRTIRIANTHLEPEPSGARVRPKQLEQIARLLNVPRLDANICAGSMCSVQDSDKTAPSEAGFADAYKGLQRDSMTWGYQPRTEIPPCRLDKVLYFPTEKVEIECPKRIGFRTMLAGGVYVSDHCGLATRVRMLRGC